MMRPAFLLAGTLAMICGCGGGSPAGQGTGYVPPQRPANPPAPGSPEFKRMVDGKPPVDAPAPPGS